MKYSQFTSACVMKLYCGRLMIIRLHDKTNIFCAPFYVDFFFRLGACWESNESFHIFLKSTFTTIFYCCYPTNKPTESLYINAQNKSKIWSRQAHHAHSHSSSERQEVKWILRHRPPPLMWSYQTPSFKMQQRNILIDAETERQVGREQGVIG